MSPAPVPTFAVRQTKFSNGEIAPTLYGDVTYPKFLASLRTCKAWLPIQNGALTKWPGTKFLGYTKFGPSSPCRLIKFVFSDAQAFVLEVGDGYIRFWQNSQYIGNDGALHSYGDGYAGGAYEVATPFVNADVTYLKFAQVGNVITFTSGAQSPNPPKQPQDLKHTSGALTPWTLSATPTQIPNGVVTWFNGPTDEVHLWRASVTYAKGDIVYYPAVAPGQQKVFWIAINDSLNKPPPNPPAPTADGTGIQGTLYWMPATDQKTNPPQATSYTLTAVVQAADGTVYEDLGSYLVGRAVYNIALSPGRKWPLGLGQPIALAAGYTLLFYRLYRSTGGNWGWVMNFTAAQMLQPSWYDAILAPGSVIYDDGRAADYTKQPPQATDPFLVNGADAYPAVVGYLDQRRVFGGGAGLPHGLELSRDGDFYNWDDKLVPGADTDAIRLLLASEVLEQVRSLTSLARGVVLTGQGEFTLSGANGGALSRSSRSAIRQSRWGSTWLNPIVIGKGLLFNTSKSNQVRDFYPLYGLYNDVWDGQDLTVAARHLFDNFTLLDWDYQSAPYPIIRAVRSDGVLLGLTYQHAPPSFGTTLTEGVVAWSKKTTGVGWDSYQNVCTVPEPPEDAVYLTAVRTVNGVKIRMIEREASPVLAFVPAKYAPQLIPTATVPGSTGVVFPDARYGVYMDASLQFDGHADPTNPNSSLFIDSVANPGSQNVADFVQGSQVTVTTGGSFFKAGDAGHAIIVLDPENVNGLGSVTLKVTGYSSGFVVTCDILDTNMTQAQVQYLWAHGFLVSNSYWAIGRDAYVVGHLSGYQVDSGQPGGARGVWVLADGFTVDPANFTWLNGNLTLTTPAVVVCVGVAYNSDAELLDAFHPNKEMRNLKKTLVRMGFEVANSRDLYVGRDKDHLQQWIEKKVASSWNMPLDTGYFEQLVRGGTDKDGRAMVRHHTPLPATLTSVLREYELGAT